MKPVRRKYTKKVNFEWDTAFSYLEDESNDSPISPTSSKERTYGPGHISAEARQILDNWMFEHRYYCYPSKLEKQQLSVATNLSIQRISNWFVNSRRRSLPKMIQSDGKNVHDFIITRKRQRSATAATSVPTRTASKSEAAVPRVSRTKIDQQRETYFNSEDYEYTLTGERVLKIPFITQIKAEATVTTPEDPLSPVSVDSPQQHFVDDVNETQNDLQTNQKDADTGPKKCITGIINDRTTNLKYLYIVVQPI